MFPTRLSFRRCFFILVIAASLLLIFLNSRHTEWTSQLNNSIAQKGQNQQKTRNNLIKSTSEKADYVAPVATKNKTSDKPKHNFGPDKRVIETEHVIIVENDSTEKRTDNSKKSKAKSIDTRPWFMNGGKQRPKPTSRNKLTRRRNAKLFPHEAAQNDRIINQLMYVPAKYDKVSAKVRKILLYNGLGSWGLSKPGRHLFRQCPVSTCSITANRNDAPYVDAILFKDHFTHPFVKRPSNQVWILYHLECPYHTPHINYPDVINWTATYRTDSDIVTPYEKWAYYDDNVKQLPVMERNYAENKTRKVAWFVSNCGARNGRLQYARELQKYIEVDIYGACGSHKCPRSSANKCFDLLDRHYKFYLAFENSNCKDYITEKFFVNGLGRDILPIAMGARPEEYARVAPYKSYLHVDQFESPKHLADYLHQLDNNDELYNSYFRWKGTGEFINTYFWCRLCAMLHDDLIFQKYYLDINYWWRWSDVCTNESWRKEKPVSTDKISSSLTQSYY